MTQKRLGFFTRLLDRVSAAERYRLATEQILYAERSGFDTAWVAQHHFHEAEGGLPSPLLFLAHVAAQTRRIRLGTGIITLPMESPLRVAEDAAVLDLLSGGRVELGLGSGGTPSSFPPFGLQSEERGEAYGRHLALLRAALNDEPLAGTDNHLYPAARGLRLRLWQATFSVDGGARAGRSGDGLMLSRTQPRPAGEPDMPLDALQNPIIDAYLDALPAGVAPRIMASRTAFVTDNSDDARRFAQTGLAAQAAQFRAQGHRLTGETLEDYIAAFDVHLGTPRETLATLSRDTALIRATDLSFQVHSIDPPHPFILRSISLLAQQVAPALGWKQAAPGADASTLNPIKETL
ncbi:putative FMN-dependent luciferase-like monooxygenase [Cronobacter sakazakii]|uniref:putative FMN-dependent luciferase-like monooxygenase n=1 Tax=Cronobacter sakazakii TaxID=28141 RepID=UPI001AEA9FC7|nr:putative FMN-dependent luciferase-like monooxygenase [Cronobacter sakazakii]EKK3981562.1 putative FMN-dependent luciferase-like monooxygenase [Cronobacter sakazakii]EKM6344874.1 putative FMN-dependent luciferase-like monooxygenase [Cronobacter sakazakii]EKM6353751.1 putative FMN-dependent luciferase-like monooxygenase [Cronobacter sakazakii]EKM6369081.1 putative FMN-dependent luciferase-like monooxygenase [Cronobacter sakazakii]EKM6377531.1 putative FMN-dependent luciferase-like monooxygena